MRYILYGFEIYYPPQMLEGCLGVFDSIPEAIDAARKDKNWSHYELAEIKQGRLERIDEGYRSYTYGLTWENMPEYDDPMPE